MNDDDNDDDEQEGVNDDVDDDDDGDDDEEEGGQKKRADVVMRAENEDLMGWLLSAVMGSARSPVKIVDPIGVNRRDYVVHHNDDEDDGTKIKIIMTRVLR